MIRVDSPRNYHSQLSVHRRRPRPRNRTNIVGGCRIHLTSTPSKSEQRRATWSRSCRVVETIGNEGARRQMRDLDGPSPWLRFYVVEKRTKESNYTSLGRKQQHQEPNSVSHRISRSISWIHRVGPTRAQIVQSNREHSNGPGFDSTAQQPALLSLSLSLYEHTACWRRSGGSSNNIVLRSFNRGKGTLSGVRASEANQILYVVRSTNAVQINRLQSVKLN